MAFPSVTVEIAFTSNPGDAPVWTDVTDYTEGEAFIEAGRESELTPDFQPGRAEVLLSNADRRFEPEYTGSPYYPNVIPMRRIRIRMTFVGVTYDLFHGYIERWPPTYEDPGMATVRVTAVDGFAVLAQATLPGSVWEVQLDADNPRAWYRLGETSGTQATDSSGNGFHGTYAGGATFNSRAGLIAYDSDHCIAFDGVDDQATISLPADTTATWSVEMWVKTTSARADLWNRVAVDQADNALGTDSQSVSIQDGKVWVAIGDISSTSFIPSTIAINDGKVHHIAVRSSAGIKIYIDNVDRTDGTLMGQGYAMPRSRMVIGAGTSAAPVEIDDVALFNPALTVAQIGAHYTVGTTPWNGDASGTRVNKVLDSIGWPAADRSVDAGRSTLQATALGGKALPYLQAVARSEGGALFMTATGNVRFRNRHALAGTALATFGDAGSELPYRGLDPDYDANKVRNVIRRGRAGGGVITVRDATSIDRYFERGDDSTDLMLASDTEVAHSADWALANQKEPALRFEAMEIDPSADETNLYPQVLGRSIGDRITALRRPPGGGTAVQRDVVIEGIRHVIGPGPRWATTWRLSPASTSEHWILGTSTLGTSTRLGY